MEEGNLRAKLITGALRSQNCFGTRRRGLVIAMCYRTSGMLLSEAGGSQHCTAVRQPMSSLFGSVIQPFVAESTIPVLLVLSHNIECCCNAADCCNWLPCPLIGCLALLSLVCQLRCCSFSPPAWHPSLQAPISLSVRALIRQLHPLHHHWRILVVLTVPSQIRHDLHAPPQRALQHAAHCCSLHRWVVRGARGTGARAGGLQGKVRVWVRGRARARVREGCCAEQGKNARRSSQMPPGIAIIDHWGCCL